MGDTQKYTVEDLLVDDKFLDWIQSDEQQYDEYWKDRLENEAPLRLVVEQAKEVALLLSVQKENVNPSAALKQLHKSINSSEITKTKRVWMKNWRVAAAIALIGMLSWVFWPQQQSYQTAFGEMETIELPDGTKVTLRANSKVWWEGDWSKNEKRTVFLEGEAYFDVRPTAELEVKRAFVVNAKPLEVEVLGTEFNLANRPSSSHVVLVEGKVAVKGEDQKHYELSPEQKYAWDKKNNQAYIETVDPAFYTDWQQNVWRFNNTSLQELAMMLNENFGKKIIFAHADLKERKLNGSAPSASLETLLFGIKSSLNISITQDKNRIIFDHK